MAKRSDDVEIGVAADERELEQIVREVHDGGRRDRHLEREEERERGQQQRAEAEAAVEREPRRDERDEADHDVGHGA